MDFNFDSQNMEDACDFTCINGGILGIYIYISISWDLMRIMSG